MKPKIRKKSPFSPVWWYAHKWLS